MAHPGGAGAAGKQSWMFAVPLDEKGIISSSDRRVPRLPSVGPNHRRIRVRWATGGFIAGMMQMGYEPDPAVWMAMAS